MKWHLFHSVFILLFLLPPVFGSDWVKHAERLTGESEAVRERAIRRLKRIPGLEGELTIALTGPDRFLAVDVIATLKLKPLLPLLIDLSKIDDTGTTYLAMNALMDEKNVESLTKLYRERLMTEQPIALVARMVILDTFGRIGYQLPAEELNRLYSEGGYEMQSAVLSYARLRLRAGVAKEAHSEFVRAALRSPYYQLRLQAVHAIKDLPEGQQDAWIGALGECQEDRREEIRKLCSDLKKSLS